MAKAHARYRMMLDHAKRWRNQEQYDELWWRMIDMYRGRQVTELTPEDRITVNISFGTLNVIYPSVSVNYPKITVAPTRPDLEDAAVVVEALVNYQWKHFGFQREFRAAVKDWLMIGHGWVKVGYKYKEKKVKLSPEEMDEQYSSMIAQADDYAANFPEYAPELPTDEQIAQHLADTQMIAEVDQPFVERISPFDVYVDPAATSLEDARWICQRIVRPLREVQSDPTYKRAVRKSVQGDLETYTERDNRDWRRRDRQTPELQYSTIWEFYDLGQGTTCTWAEGADDYLVDPQEIPFAFGHPFVMLRNYDIPEHFYPMGDLESIESLQMELNKTRSQMMQARKKYARKYLYKSSAFGPEGRQALESDVDNTFVEAADDGVPLNELIAPLPQVPLSPEIYQHSQVVEQDIATVSGVSEYQRGQVPETRRTATEAAIISDSVSARAADKLATIESGLALVARRVIQVCQQYVTGDQVFRVTGNNGAMVWVPWTREEILGEYDFEVEAGSTQPMNETVRRQTAVALSQAMAPFVQMGIVDPAALARHLLQFGFNVRNAEKFLTQQMPMPQPGGMPGIGGNQGPPMGGGYINQETGDNANEGGQVVPFGIRSQLNGQVGLAMPNG